METKKTKRIKESGPKHQTTLIKASSRMSIKVGDSYYTVEYTEERSVMEGANLHVERAALWDTVNDECDNQIEEILKSVRK